MTNANIARLLDRQPQPRISDGIVHPVTVRHKTTLEGSLACLNFHVGQALVKHTGEV